VRSLRRLGATAPVAAILATLVVLLPRAGRAQGDALPAIDLGTVRLDDQGAHAKLVDGGEAELTLDPTLERAAQRLLARARPVEGAVTLIEAKTGKILVFAESLRPRAPAGSVLTEPTQPSASVFKIVTTTALLESGEIGIGTKVCISGGNHSIERRHLDPPRHGRISCAPFGLALGHSKNAVYAQMATHHLTRQRLVDVARRFGFNQSVPSDVPAKVGTLQVPYGDLDFARASAGFQGSTLSPLGAAVLAYTVAAGGRAVRLHLVAHAPGYDLPDGRQIAGRVTDAWTAHLLSRMMEVTVREGTSAAAFTDPETDRSYLPGIRVAGKTGTLRPDASEMTSWFTGFAPSRKPEVVVSVLLVNGKVWRQKANELARDLLRVYFRAHGHRGVSDPFDDKN
jgi:penicillin-binding protein A